MSPRAKWLEDLGRNRARRVSRSDLDAGAPFTLFEEHVADPAEGPETARTTTAVTTLVRGIQTPVQSSCNDPYAAKARESDPETSKAAAKVVTPGGEACIILIRGIVERAGSPVTTDVIAAEVMKVLPDRWSAATIKTRVSQACLHVFDREGLSDRGQRCTRYDGLLPRVSA